MGEKKKEKTSQHVHIVKSLLKVNSRICFLLAQKKAAKKIAAVKKTPKPSFAERLRKTILNLNNPS